jgi:hypothetical protein
MSRENDLSYLIVKDETYESIIDGVCSCGLRHVLITGSNKTFRRDGRRWTEPNPHGLGWSSFRCSSCGECIDESWRPIE